MAAMNALATFSFDELVIRTCEMAGILRSAYRHRAAVPALCLLDCSARHWIHLGPDLACSKLRHEGALRRRLARAVDHRAPRQRGVEPNGEGSSMTPSTVPAQARLSPPARAFFVRFERWTRQRYRRTTERTCERCGRSGPDVRARFYSPIAPPDEADTVRYGSACQVRSACNAYHALAAGQGEFCEAVQGFFFDQALRDPIAPRSHRRLAA